MIPLHKRLEKLYNDYEFCIVGASTSDQKGTFDKNTEAGGAGPPVAKMTKR